MSLNNAREKAQVENRAQSQFIAQLAQTTLVYSFIHLGAQTAKSAP